MFYDTFKKYCKLKGVSVSKAASDIGLSNSTPTKWKKTGATPETSTLVKIADYFHIPLPLLYEDVKEGPIDKAISEFGTLYAMASYLFASKDLLNLPPDSKELLGGLPDPSNMRSLLTIIGDAIFSEASDSPLRQQLLEYFSLLSAKGQCVAVERLKELAQIPQYQKNSNSNEHTSTQADEDANTQPDLTPIDTSPKSLP